MAGPRTATFASADMKRSRLQKKLQATIEEQKAARDKKLSKKAS